MHILSAKVPQRPDGTLRIESFSENLFTTELFTKVWKTTVELLSPLAGRSREEGVTRTQEGRKQETEG